MGRGRERGEGTRCVGRADWSRWPLGLLRCDCAADFFCVGFCSLLPGDGAEQTEADDQTEGGGDEDGPGVGGEAERGMSVGGSHCESPWKKRDHTKDVWDAAAEF